MKPKDIIIAVFLLSVVGLLSYVWISPSGIKIVPDMQLTTFDGKKIQLRKPENMPALITMWATTCTTCLKEIPHLNELHQAYGPKGLKVIGVSMYYDPPIQVGEMIKKKNILYPVVMDIDKKIIRAFKVKPVITPTTYLVSPQGKIVLQKAGLLDMEKLKKTIEEMLSSS
jgi:peroxiredoxin